MNRNEERWPAGRLSPETTREWMQLVRGVTLKARGVADSLFIGEHVSPFRGRGLEVKGVREFQPGDDPRFIDWKVTARLGRHHVKELSEERQVPVLIVVDRSGSLSGGRGRRCGALLVETAAALSLAAERGGDPVGLLQITDRMEGWRPPTSGPNQAFKLVRDLLALVPGGQGTDLSVGLSFANRVLPSRSLVLLLSDFLLPPQGLSRTSLELAHLADRHDVVPLQIVDSHRGDLPQVGVVRFTDPESGSRRWVNTAGQLERRKYREGLEARERDAIRMFRAAGPAPLTLKVGEPIGPPLRAYFLKRGRQR